MRVVLVALALVAGCRCGGAEPEPHVTAIAVSYPGASAEDVERAIVMPLESAVAGLGGVTSLSARSEKGSALVVVTSERDLVAAVQERVQGVLRQLPADIEHPTIRRVDPDAPFAAAYRITGDLPPVQLSELADRQVKARLERIVGVGEVVVRGGVERRIAIHPDATRLASHGVTLDDLATAIQRANVDVPAGRIEAGARDVTLRIEGRLDLQGIEQLVVAQRADVAVRIADVARVAHTTTPRTGEPLHLGIRLQRGVPREEVLDALATAVGELRAQLPPGVAVAEHPIEPAKPRHVLRGPDRAVLAQLAGAPRSTPNIEISIDRARAAELGIETAAIANTLALAGGRVLGHVDRDPIAIALDLPIEQLLSEIFVRAGDGQLVPLAALVRATQHASAAVLERVDRMPAIAVDDPSRLPRELPPGYALQP